MEIFADFIVKYAAAYAGLLIAGYLVPAGCFYWLFHVRPNAWTEAQRIQKNRRATKDDITREIADSLRSIGLFAFYLVLLLELVARGHMRLYFALDDYPLYYVPLGLVVAVIGHDTYFYWTHRLMHTRLLFRHVHRGHHVSRTPTPWSILTFQPLETIPQFGFFALLVLLMPMHPVTFLAYFMYDGFVNAAGHSGHELLPQSHKDHRLLRYLNAVAHHDLHHTRVSYNFSQYFNVWDRLMGTFLDRDAAAELRPERNAGQTARPA